ncbi:malonate decarboxylase subunit alpha [Xanthobacteraceae bacterium Astr-EGSB]|uniref:acyl CoA:acetate/3-ketoacid CoA transferase n=1 Tax=Astrobacterium formosum TaxID=3069710 RepID=UPI0027B0DA37|nr:malonate decarboxylase subunit alpha [Xanthobacteraceae bacterium Astr-EGSB]
MTTGKIMSFDEAAALIADGDVVTVSSSSGLNCPDRMLRAIGERFAREGHPRDITSLHPIAAGDMYGIKGIDHIAKAGLLARAIAGSYPSGPSSAESPEIWKMIERNAIAAYNVPSGILFDMHREVAAKRAGVMTKVGIGTYVDPDLQGSAMNAAGAAAPIVRKIAFEGEDWLYFPNIAPNVAILRATTADEDGNLSMEHEGAYLGAMDLALAARNSGGIVIAQVKRVCARHTIPTQRVFVPSNLVDVIVVDPEQVQATQTIYDPAISGEIRRPMSSFEPDPFNAEKVVARRAAMELLSGGAANLGFGISALVPGILLEEGLHGQVTWVIEQGAVGGLPLTGFVFGCAANAEAIVPAPYQFIYFQGGGFDVSLLSFMEVDTAGNVNVSRLAAKPHVTAGCGGFVDITAHARKLVFSGFFRAGGLDLEVGGGRLAIRREGKFPKFVPAVEHVTFAGARAAGRDILYITERCVIRLMPEGLTVVEIAPGIDLDKEVLAQAAIPLKVSPDIKTMDSRLFTDAPMQLCLPVRPSRIVAARERARA